VKARRADRSAIRDALVVSGFGQGPVEGIAGQPDLPDPVEST
jgi:hypothetical protein